MEQTTVSRRRKSFHHHLGLLLPLLVYAHESFITPSYVQQRLYNEAVDKAGYCVPSGICGLIRPMAFFDDVKLLKDIGPQTIAEYERRAGISVQTLLDAIVRDRVRHPPNPASHLAHTKECNDPTLKATGELALLEETKAFKMLMIIAEFRDGPEGAKFSLRHAYTTAGIHRQTLIGWRGDHKLFDSIMDSIQEEMVDTMRAEAYRRSVVGHDEPIVHQGVKTGDTVKKFSDSLLQFTLMGYDAKFRSKDVNMNVSGQLDSNINIEGLRDRLAQRLNSRSKAE